MLNGTSPSVTPSLARATSTITPKIDLAQKKPDDPKPDDKQEQKKEEKSSLFATNNTDKPSSGSLFAPADKTSKNPLLKG